MNYLDGGEHCHAVAVLDQPNAEVQVLGIVAAVAILLEYITPDHAGDIAQLPLGAQRCMSRIAQLSNTVVIQATEELVVRMNHGVIHDIAVAAAVLSTRCGHHFVFCMVTKKLDHARHPTVADGVGVLNHEQKIVATGSVSPAIAGITVGEL